MAEESGKTLTAPTNPGAPTRKVVVSTPKQNVTPFAFRETKLRASMVETIQNLTPDGLPDPAQLENIRSFVLAEIDAIPSEFNAVEVIIESHVLPGARRAQIIVFPKKF